MGIEIILFNAVGGWDLTTIIDFSFIEHLLLTVVFDDVAIRISKITAFVGRITVLVERVSLGILENNNVALVISVKVSKYIMLVEVSGVIIWRRHDWWIAILELNKRLLGHFKCINTLLARIKRLVQTRR